MAARKSKRQEVVDSSSLLGKNEELDDRNAYYVSQGLKLDPKARRYKAKAGWTLVMVWRGEGGHAMIETTRFRDIKRTRDDDDATEQA